MLNLLGFLSIGFSSLFVGTPTKGKFTPDFHKDIQWFLVLLPTYNGISYISKSNIDDSQSLFLDACLTLWHDRVYIYISLYTTVVTFKLKIVHLEMLNIVVALRVCGSLWLHSSISVRCDNLGVVQVVKTGKTKDCSASLVKSALDRTKTAYRPSTKSLITHILSFTIFMPLPAAPSVHSFLVFMEFLYANSLSYKVILNYISSTQQASRRFNWTLAPFIYDLVITYLRCISINSKFSPTPRGIFDLSSFYPGFHFTSL